MQLHPASKSLLLNVPNPGSIISMMPAVELNDAGFNLAVKHTASATKLLRSVGIPAPSPIVSYYNWPKFKAIYAPFDHQRLMAEFVTMHHRCFVLSEMGTGKTAAMLWAADWMMSMGLIKKVLIVAPLSTLERTWMDAVFNTLMHRRAVVIHGPRDKRLANLEMDVDFYIINHDGLSIGPVREAIQKRTDIDTVIVDEGSKFRNSDTDKWRNLERTINKPFERRVWWMTGTPCPNGPDDSWAQCRLVAPGRVPRFFGAFRRSVMMEVSEHVWKPREGGYKEAFKAMQPAIRFAKADCLDLPPCTTVDWEAEMSNEQTKAFKSMLNDMKIEDATAKAEGKEITAMNAADKLNKLRQILLGAVKAPDGTYTEIPATPRFKLLKDAIELAAAKVIIIVPFKGAIRMIERELAKTTTVGMLNGDVSIGKRNKIIQDFKTTAEPHVLACHPAVMSHGLDLTEADTLVFYGPIYSNDEFRQVMERFNRPGQTRKMTIIRIGGSKLEWAIYKMLDGREMTQANILDLYRDTLERKAAA